MTSKQLYYAQSPLWAKTLSPLEIEYIQAAQDNIDRLQLEQNKLDPILDVIDTNPNDIRHFSLRRTKRIRVFAPQLGKAQTQILYDIKYKGIKYARTFRNINNQSI